MRRKAVVKPYKAGVLPARPDLSWCPLLSSPDNTRSAVSSDRRFYWGYYNTGITNLSSVSAVLQRHVCVRHYSIVQNLLQKTQNYLRRLVTIKWCCYGFPSIQWKKKHTKDQIICSVIKKWINFWKMTLTSLVMFSILMIMSSVCVSVLSVQQWAEQPSSVFVNPGGEVTLACRILNKKVNNIDILFVLPNPRSSRFSI